MPILDQRSKGILSHKYSQINKCERGEVEDVGAQRITLKLFNLTKVKCANDIKAYFTCFYCINGEFYCILKTFNFNYYQALSRF